MNRRLSQRDSLRVLVGQTSLGLAVWMTVAGCGTDTNFAEGQTNRTRPLTAEEQADLRGTLVKEYVAGSIEPGNVSVDTGFGLIEQPFVMQQKSVTKELSQQINRPSFHNKFTQGQDGTQTTDKFAVVDEGMLDVLIVMDNSGTMKSMQDQLAVSMPQLLRHIQNVNWQIAVVTTDSSCLRKTASGKRTVTKADFIANRVQAEADYAQLISVGTSGSNVERGILFAADGLRGNCGDSSDDWKREDSTKTVLIVTDEKNCGSAENEGCVGQPYATADYFTSRMPLNTRVYGLFFLEKDYNPNCPDSGGYENQYPTEYVKLVNDTKGIFGEICQKDYTQILEAISADVGERVIQKFDLSYLPEQIVEVKVDGVVMNPSQYYTDGNTLVLRAKLDMNTKGIDVTYKHGSVPRTQTFVLSDDPDLATLQVYVNQVQQDSGSVIYTQSKKELKFSNMPADKAKIDVKYRKNQKLPSDFKVVGKGYVKDSVKVLVDGVETTDFTWSLDNKTLTLKKAPADGASVEVNYEMPGDRQTSYPATKLGGRVLDDFQVVDATTGNSIPVQLVNEQIVFAENMVSGGRKVIAKYDPHFEGDDLKFELDIPQIPLPGTLEVLGDGDATICAKDMVQADQHVSFACVSDKATKVDVNYRYIANYTTVFDVPGLFNDRKEWHVYIDDIEYFNYEKNDLNSVVIPASDLPVGSRVKIVIMPPTEETK